MQRSHPVAIGLFLLTVSLPGQAVLHVGPGGYATIQAALAAAPATVTLRLAPGIHVGPWSIQNRSVRFVADGPGVIVDPLLCSCTMQAGDRLEFSGLRLARTTPSLLGAFTVAGGTATLDDCAIGAMTISFDDTNVHLRHCVSSTSTVILRNGDATVSSSTLAGGPAVWMRGGTLQLASSSLQGSADNPALTVQTNPLGLWVVDSQLTGGESQIGAGAPAVTGPLVGLRVHRSTFASGTGPFGQSPPLPATATVQPGALLGVESLPAAVTTGSTIQLLFRAEPGDAVLAIGGFTVSEASSIPGVEQRAFGMNNAIVMGLLLADGTGLASTSVAVPNHPAFANLAIVFRGVDVSRTPLQLSPVVPVVVR